MNHARPGLACIAAVALVFACKPAEPPAPPPPLSPVELEAKNRAECHVIAVGQARFDPTLAEAPPRTISETHQKGGDVVGSGAIAKGAVVGGLVGVAGGAIAGNAGAGAAIGAGAGGLIGGVRRHRDTQKMVTTSRTNPEYTAYVESKNAYRSAFDGCMNSRAAQPVAPPVAQ